MALTPSFPGVFIEEQPSGVHAIKGVATAITAFVGFARNGAPNTATHISSFVEYQRIFGTLAEGGGLGYAVLSFFDNGGTDAYVIRVAPDDSDPPGRPGTQDLIAALAALDKIDFNLLSIPDATRTKPNEQQALDDNIDPVAIFGAAMDYCTACRAFLLMDPPPDVATANDMRIWRSAKLQITAQTARYIFRASRSPTRRAAESRAPSRRPARSPASMRARMQMAACGRRPPGGKRN